MPCTEAAFISPFLPQFHFMHKRYPTWCINIYFLHNAQKILAIVQSRTAQLCILWTHSMEQSAFWCLSQNTFRRRLQRVCFWQWYNTIWRHSGIPGIISQTTNVLPYLFTASKALSMWCDRSRYYSGIHQLCAYKLCRKPTNRSK